jgi:hypothetical protein
MSDLYPALNMSSGNIMSAFIYANQVTNYLFIPIFCLSFFLIILITSIVYQIRFTSRVRFEVSLLASSFSLFGLELILEQMTGLLSPLYFILSIVVFIISAIWVFMTND